MGWAYKKERNRLFVMIWLVKWKKEWQQSNVFDKHADWTWDFYRYHGVRETILG